MPSVKKRTAGSCAGPEREARERSREALAGAAREVEPLLLSIATRLCRNVSDANDLVQDTFERALLSTGDQPIRNPRAWLLTILHHLFVDRCRASARRPAVESLHENHASAVGAGEEPQPEWSRVTLADLRAALGEIGPDFARVYEMHVFERHSYEAIAALLGIRPVTVGTRLNRARRKLRAALCRRLDVRETLGSERCAVLPYWTAAG